MATKRDIVDMILTARVDIGVTYLPIPPDKDESKKRVEQATKLADIKQELEAYCIERMQKVLGYTEEYIEKLLAYREKKQAADAKAEKEGRAAKAKKRAGLQ